MTSLAVIAVLDPSQIFQLLATGLGIIGIISTAAVILRSTVLVQNNTQLRNAYHDTRDQLQDKDKELARVEGERDQLKQRVAVLADVITAREQLTQLSEQLQSALDVTRGDHESMMEVTEAILEEVRRRDAAQHRPSQQAPRSQPRRRAGGRG